MAAIPDWLSTILNTTYNPSNINNYFNTASGNLSAAQGSAANQARSSMGALAASRGLLNPSAAITGAGSQVYGQYAPLFGQLEQGRAQALQQNQLGYYDAVLRTMFGINQQDLQQQALDAQKNPNLFDYLGLGTKIGGMQGFGKGGAYSLLGSFLA